MKQRIHEILMQYWGFSTFRPLQEEIILSAIDGKDTLALLPTGGGKSITFQVPGLVMDGICIVITPLIALMKDQVSNLQKRNIKAKALYSGMSQSEIRYILENAISNELKFLYVSPERAASSMFREFFSKMTPCLIAIDEAHCISQWGYDFRPPYLQIAELREYHPNIPVLAVTATATPPVVQDIMNKLKFKTENIFQKSFYRKNLNYDVYQVEDKLNALLLICRENPGSAVVYVRNRKKTKEIANFLLQNKINADFYHAGLDGEIRDKKQAEWTNNKKRIIVSTNAFGMGIDKPDVRFVVHMDLADCIEAYFQEAGRAGRDEKSAKCIILYNNADIMQSKQQLEQSFPDLNYIKNIYFLIGNYFQIAVGTGKDLCLDFNISNFCESYNLNIIEAFHALSILEKQGLILLSEAIYSPSRIMFKSNSAELYKFQVENPALEPLIKILLRSYTGLFSDYVKIDEESISQRINAPKDKVILAINKLNKLEILSYLPYTDSPKITFLHSRIDERNIILDAEIYQNRKQKAFERLEAIIDYVSNKAKCRSQFLLEYFGERKATRCGICDVCMNRNNMDVNKLEFDTIVETIKPRLMQSPTPQKIVYDWFSFEERNKLNEVLKWLVDNDKIIIDTYGIMKWKQ